MVGCSDRDLTCRSARLDREFRDRRRREKRSPMTPERATLYKDRLLAAERVQGARRIRRVLFQNFEENENKPVELKDWIAAKLNDAADESKKKWNFDFESGAPANIPGHRLQWQRTDGEDEAATPEGAAECSAPVAEASSTAVVPDENVNLSEAAASSPKIALTSAKRDRRQGLITDYLRPSKFAKTAVKGIKTKEPLAGKEHDTVPTVKAE